MTLIFKLHYFLWYGSVTSIFGYESVYARYYINAEHMQYGYVNMILLFISVLLTPVICSLADRYKAHRNFFVITTITTLLSIVFYNLMPILMHAPDWDSTNRQLSIAPGPNSDGPLKSGPWIYFIAIALLNTLSMDISTSLSDSFAVLQAETHNTSFGRLVVWGTFGWTASALVLMGVNRWSFVPRLVPGLMFGAFLLSLDTVLISFWPHSEDFDLTDVSADAALAMRTGPHGGPREPSDYYDGGIRINLGNERDAKDGHIKRRTMSPLQMMAADSRKKPKPNKKQQPQKTAKGSPDSSTGRTADGRDKASPVSSFVKYTPATLRDLARSKLHISQLVSVVAARPIDNKIGQSSSSRLLISPTTNQPAADVQTTKSQSSKTNKGPTSFRVQITLLALVLKRRRQLVRYLLMFVLAGFFMSMQWNYFFLFLEELHQQEFEFVSAMSMVGQSMLGELPFFILSSRVINLLGRSHTISFSIVTIGIRYLLYRYLLPYKHIYFTLMADFLQGPNYGLFYVAMTETSLEFSYADDETVAVLGELNEVDITDKHQIDSIRLLLRSTIQSVSSACYEGIGVGLGSLVGGWLSGKVGYQTLYLYMGVGAVIVGLLNSVIELACREEDPGVSIRSGTSFGRTSSNANSS